jgi:5'-nucleotidase
VAAAAEAAFYRRVAIAVSLEYTKPGPLNFSKAAEVSRTVIERIIAGRPQGGSLFNVNIPDVERGPIRGVRVAPQNVAPYSEQFDRRTDPRGRVYFWNVPGTMSPEPLPDTDQAALADGFVTVTPLQFNLTHSEQLTALQRWDWRL